MAEKIDLKKQFKEIYRPSPKRVDFLDLGPMNYLMIDGKGDPGGPAFARAVQALFGVSYTMKFQIKKGPTQVDYGVMPLEGLWWAKDMADFTDTLNRDNWHWTAMIRQPDFITQNDIDGALAAAAKKKDPPVLDGLRFETFTEGKVAQIMHVGPFTEEGPTVERLHGEIAAQGKSLRGKHHEVYLSDIRRADPKNWKTILRQPLA